MSTWRALRLCAPGEFRRVETPLYLGIIIGLLAVGAVAAAFSGDWLRFGLAAVVLPVCVLYLVVGRRLVRPLGSRGALETTATSQPALHALVHDTARRCGLAPPRRIRLDDGTAIAAEPGGLVLGRALLAALSEAGVRALVAHELTVANHPRARLVVPMLALWDQAMTETRLSALMGPDRQVMPAARRRLIRRAPGLLRDLGAFADQVHALADRAAIDAAGRDEAARALALTAVVWQNHLDLRVFDLTHGGYVVSDLNESWRRLLARGVRAEGWDPEAAADLGRRHPALAPALAALGLEPVRLGLVDGVEVVPLAEADERRLLARHPERALHGQPTAVADIPASVWPDRAAVDSEPARSGVARVLGRDPHDDVELVQVVVTRRDQVFELAPGDEVDLYRLINILGYVVEWVLLARGWRLEHPALRGVLVSPAGERVDTAALVPIVGGVPDLTALREVLR